MSHESIGQSDEWYTPKYIFDALEVEFDLDVASPKPPVPWIPAKEYCSSYALQGKWNGFVWMNPPFGKRNGLMPWLKKFVYHGNGIALTPDRSSTPWWQYIASNSDAILFVWPKVKFIRPDGSTGDSPSNGTTLFAIGPQGTDALIKASKTLGVLVKPTGVSRQTND